jgi:hypothetical protein
LRSARTRPSGGSRLSAALIALGFVLSSLIGLVHEATTRHVQCAEHGEQIHSEGAPSGRAAPDHSVQSTPGAAVHGHEHCLIASATRASRIAPSAPALEPALRVAAPVTAVARRAAAPTTDRLYRTAPKTSPPA